MKKKVKSKKQDGVTFAAKQIFFVFYFKESLVLENRKSAGFIDGDMNSHDDKYAN